MCLPFLVYTGPGLESSFYFLLSLQTRKLWRIWFFKMWRYSQSAFWAPPPRGDSPWGYLWRWGQGRSRAPCRRLGPAIVLPSPGGWHLLTTAAVSPTLSVAAGPLCFLHGDSFHSRYSWVIPGVGVAGQSCLHLVYTCAHSLGFGSGYFLIVLNLRRVKHCQLLHSPCCHEKPYPSPAKMPPTQTHRWSA